MKIYICCAGGLSSSVLAKRGNQELIELNKQDAVSINLMPFRSFIQKQQPCDVVRLWPHQRFAAEDWLKQTTVDYPVYTIPSQIYGLLNAKTIIEDGEDIIEIFKNNHQNPAYFPGEKEVLTNKRKVSYREVNKK